MIPDELNAAQLEAVSHEGGPLLVLAPAGSGKTRVVIARLLYLFERHGWTDDRILAVTFTRKSSREMLHRIAQARPGSRLPWVGTFHSVAARMLRQYAERIGLPREFTIVDGGDQRQMIRDLVEVSDLSGKDHDPKGVLSRISHWKTTGVSPEEAQRTSFGPFRSQAVLYQEYQARLESQKALDFDDLLVKLTELLKSQEDVRSFYQDQFEHILVDEYQDTNAAQETLLRLLSRNRTNVTVVGDDDQSIYRFRGANVGHILSFTTEYPLARRIVLSMNYRSTRFIVGAASSMISASLSRIKKEMSSTGRHGEMVLLKRLDNERDEARYVADRILSRVSAGGLFRDQAVLFRMNAQAQSFVRAFTDRQIPFQTRMGGDGFFTRKEIRDLLAYLRVSANPFDRLSLFRILNVPTRGFGDKTRERLERLLSESTLPAAHLFEKLSRELGGKAGEVALRFAEDLSLGTRIAQEGGVPSHLLAFWKDRVRYESYLEDSEDAGGSARSRLENLAELIRMAERFEKDRNFDGDRLPVGVFLEELALSQEDPGDPSAGEMPDRVSLLTIHQAKGLEFSHVYLTGAEEDILPMRSRERTDVEEERRLFYVAMTRARDSLTISYCLTRQLFGRTDSLKPSRFLMDLPKEAVSGDRPSIPPIRSPERFQSKAPERVPSQNRYGPARSGASPASSRLPSLSPPKTMSRSIIAAPRPDWIGKPVVHPRFGKGVVESATGNGGDLELTIRFEGGSVRHLLERYANLDIPE
ncbi:MAG: ATP-dependent helicase [Leptospirales bacterium]